MKSRWKKFLLYAGVIIIAGSFLYGGQLLILWGYSIPGSGLPDYISPNGDFIRGKTLWDWMELLIIPIFLAGGAFFLQQSERAVEREIAKNRQQEVALQAYIDKMSELLLDEGLRTTEETKIRNVARTRTLSIIQVLDKKRNELVIQFLREVKLVTDDNSILNRADMEGMDLQGLDLRQIYFQNANFLNANLRETDLRGANLWKANMRNADLQDADLRNAEVQEVDLQDANLKWANLRGTNLSKTNLQNADLRKADLFDADLQESKLQLAKLRNTHLAKADLRDANLYNADLRGANLQDATATSQQLGMARSLKGTLMPKGYKHK